MRRLLAPLVLVMLATECAATPSGSAPTTPAAESPAAEAPVALTPVVIGPGEYTYENATGTIGTMSFPGTPEPEIEKLRALVEGESATYLAVKVVNRKGTVGVNMYGVSIFTPDGHELKYVNADSYTDGVRPSGAPAEVYNTFIKLGNTHAEMVDPVEVKDFVLVGPPVPELFTGVVVHPTGGYGEVNAQPVGKGQCMTPSKSQGPASTLRPGS